MLATDPKSTSRALITACLRSTRMVADRPAYSGRHVGLLCCSVTHYHDRNTIYRYCTSLVYGLSVRAGQTRGIPPRTPVPDTPRSTPPTGPPRGASHRSPARAAFTTLHVQHYRGVWAETGSRRQEERWRGHCWLLRRNAAEPELSRAGRPPDPNPVEPEHGRTGMESHPNPVEPEHGRTRTRAIR